MLRGGVSSILGGRPPGAAAALSIPAEGLLPAAGMLLGVSAAGQLPESGGA